MLRGMLASIPIEMTSGLKGITPKAVDILYTKYHFFIIPKFTINIARWSDHSNVLFIFYK